MAGHVILCRTGHTTWPLLLPSVQPLVYLSTWPPRGDPHRSLVGDRPHPDPVLADGLPWGIGIVDLQLGTGIGGIGAGAQQDGKQRSRDCMGFIGSLLTGKGSAPQLRRHAIAKLLELGQLSIGQIHLIAQAVRQTALPDLLLQLASRLGQTDALCRSSSWETVRVSHPLLSSRLTMGSGCPHPVRSPALSP